jgi:pseudouridylate synthase
MRAVTTGGQAIAVSERVADAIRGRDPIVALESTIITHGLPQPQNLEAAVEFERTVESHGAVPATIGMIDGTPTIGLTASELERLATDAAAIKLSARDLPVAMAQRTTGGTTVAATAWLASQTGIRVFVTGGIGGVHRDASTTFDESADLGVLSRSRITVICAGVKSILDIGATLERLETLSVVVLGYRTRSFPAFWLPDSGHDVDWSVNTPGEVAAVMQAADGLGLPGGILVANPLPEDAQLDAATHDQLLEDAVRAGAAASVRGKNVTPFLLDYMDQHTEHRSLDSNLALVRWNCSLGAEIAGAWSALQQRGSH